VDIDYYSLSKGEERFVQRVIRLKTKYLIIKRGLFSSILILSILLSHANAIDNKSENINDNLSNNMGNEYFLIVNNEPVFADNSKNIVAGEKLEFRIFDNSTKKFTTDGTIIFESKRLNITQHGFVENVKDKFKGFLSNVVGGDDTWGNNSEYFIEYLFEETSNNYTMNAIGEYSSIKTNNKIILKVKTNYITQIVGKTNRTYESISMRDLAGRNLKYHKDRDGKNADDLIKNINDFLAVSDELNKKIDNLTNHSDKAQLDNLPVNNVLSSKLKLEKSIEILQDQSKTDHLIKDQISAQLNFIEKDTNNITQELAKDLNRKKDILLKNELKNAQALEEKKTNEFSSGKSNLINEVFYPAGLSIILGFIIGYFNVNRWKKESEYFGLYTSKANIMSPITIALIITVIILAIVGGVVYFEDSLGMLEFLI